MIIDAFPFFNELDVLEIRLAELAPIVDKFVIAECRETYGGNLKPLYLQSNYSRFAKWHDKIVPCVIDKLEPALPVTLHDNNPNVQAGTIRTIGRQREAYMRNAMLPFIMQLNPNPHSILSFGDCDEIPRASAIHDFIHKHKNVPVARLKQRTYYYNVNTQIDYGRDICSRARVGLLSEIPADGLYGFRMLGNKQPNFPAIEEAGWHFSYFGGTLAKLHEKVEALNPFLTEYKLFGNRELVNDILRRRDLHRRPVGFSELPEMFDLRKTDDPLLPAHFLNNLERFDHFTQLHFEAQYNGRV